MSGTNDTVAFVTSAWERDWDVVLWPQRYKMIVQSHHHEFPIRLVVLNNFASDRTLAKAIQAARKLVTMGLATHYLLAPTYVDEKVLHTFGMATAFFWQYNPYYSTNHLAALHWLRNKTTYVLNMSGDIWLDRSCDWLPRALAVFENHPQIRGMNLCRNIYEGFYPTVCHEEHNDFWLSHPTQGIVTEGKKGFGLSDIAYLIKVSPQPCWRFDATPAELETWFPNWPKYARPCFEHVQNLVENILSG